MSSRIRAHIRSNVVGYIALFCFAIGGSANALPGANTVQSNDIGPGQQVKNRDTKPIKSNWLADGSIGTGQIDATEVQRRVGGTCAANSSISTIAADGSVTCEADTGSVVTDLGFHLTETCAGNTQKYAVVSSSGTLVRGANAVSASRLTIGTYVVTFDAAVTGCAHNATIGQPGSVGASSPGVATVAGRSGNANAIFVKTYETQEP
jgi:hypothetical protein